MKRDPSRRRFLAGAAAGMTTLKAATTGERPALLGGSKVRTQPFPSWPKFDEREEKGVLDTLRSGKWYRGSGQTVSKFEEAYAKLTGAKHVLATANGTSALIVSLGALGLEAGDEVIVPPYTFIATINAVLRFHALPVFVDSDLETFQIDHRKIGVAITPETRVLLPVHIGGSAFDIDSVLAIGAKHKIPVLEDACQSVLGEWKGRKLGTYGAAGCFSFQASKNLNSGEGGAILFNDAELRERAYTFHNNGSGTKSGGLTVGYLGSGGNFRMPEFQAALLLAQMTRLEQQ